MIEMQDSSGNLVVVLPMRLRHAGSFACVFRDGKKMGEFGSVGEAARYARSLAQAGCPGPQEEPTGPAGG